MRNEKLTMGGEQQNLPGDGVSALAARMAAHASGRRPFIVGLTGSVASGKTTLAKRLADALLSDFHVETVSTDGFLFPNNVLDARNLTLRKGFPETYDTDAMAQALRNIRQGVASFPAYSHVTYDVAPELTVRLETPDVLILEGLGFTSPGGIPRSAGEPDIFVYLHAERVDLERWYLERFVRLWRAAESDPTSFYAQFLHMNETELVAFAKSVWERINLPNLIDHILPLRDDADIVVEKDADHRIRIVDDRL